MTLSLIGLFSMTQSSVEPLQTQRLSAREREAWGGGVTMFWWSERSLQREEKKPSHLTNTPSTYMTLKLQYMNIMERAIWYYQQSAFHNQHQTSQACSWCIPTAHSHICLREYKTNCGTGWPKQLTALEKNPQSRQDLKQKENILLTMANSCSDLKIAEAGSPLEGSSNLYGFEFLVQMVNKTRH